MAENDVTRDDLRLSDTGADGKFGVRVDCQSEAVQVEAAEFLLATRAQQERRLRIAKDLDALRILEHPAS